MKFIEDQRVGLPHRKSTRYVNWSKVGGRYLYYIPCPDLNAAVCSEYTQMDHLFDTYVNASAPRSWLANFGEKDSVLEKKASTPFGIAAHVHTRPGGISGQRTS
jgi:hypothetical protein